MPATLSLNAYPNGVDNTQRRLILHGIVALSGTYATGGIALNWQAISQGNGGEYALDTAQATPEIVYFQSVAGNTTQYSYAWNKAANKIQIFVSGASGAPAAELGAVTVPTDTVEFEAQFIRSI
jgi:hypothetical protein